MKIYQGTIEYNNGRSSYMFSETSLEKISKVMEDGLKFYTEFGITEAKIEALCDKCWNDGTFKKPTRNKIVRKTVKCDCNRQYANEIYHVSIPVC